MKKLAMSVYGNVLRSGMALFMTSEALLHNPKRFIQKTVLCAEKLCCNSNCLVSSRLSQFASSSCFHSGFFKSQNAIVSCTSDYREYKDHSDWHGIGLVPLFALALFHSKNEEEEEEKRDSELVTMMKMGILALQRGQLDKAEQLLHIALKTAQEGQNSQAVTYIFDLLANLAYQREEYEKAEKLFKEVMKRMFANGMEEDDNAVVEISLKLAGVYALRGEYEKAVQGFHFCLGTQEEKIKRLGEGNIDEDTLLLWSMSMDWYARFLLSIQKYDLAKKHFIKAYEMSERVQGSKHPQTAVLLNDIGSVCSLQKNYSEAVTYLEKAIDAARESESPDIGSFYVNLGAVYLQQAMLLEAERCCKEGLSLARKSKNNEAVVEAETCLREIGVVKGEAKKS